MINIILISLEASVVILLMLIMSPLLNRRYSAKWRYYVWLLLAIRLCVPFRLELPAAPVRIPTESRVIVMPSETSQMRIVPESEYTEPVNEGGKAEQPFTEDKPLTYVSAETAAFAIWIFGVAAFFPFM